MTDWVLRRPHPRGGCRFWLRQLADGTWLAVAQPPQAWAWSWLHLCPDGGPPRQRADGHLSAADARSAADLYASLLPAHHVVRAASVPWPPSPVRRPDSPRAAGDPVQPQDATGPDDTHH